MIEQTKFNLKIFQIDKSYYEFKNKSTDKIVQIIKDNHERKLRHNYQDLTLIEPKVTYQDDGDFEFWSYCFNQPKEKYYWKLFLPGDLTENQNFDIVEFSFVLFIGYQSEIYCIISGSGMSVIRKYINPSFGIDLYQRISKPEEDVILDLEIRGIANNISQKKQIFNFNQTIAETLDYSEVPTKMKLRIREDLKNNEFKKYSFDSNVALMELGSYFSIRKKLNFDELKLLVKDMNEIKYSNEPVQLTLFLKINDPDLVNELDETLKEIIVDDVILHNKPDEARYYQSDIIEVVHPTKLEHFYECNNFLIRAKHSKGKNDIALHDRIKLYFECTKHIFNNLDDITNRQKIKGNLYKLNIVGKINKKEVTYGNFFSHITAEIEYLGRKYFKIDGHWYLLDDNFLRLMNNDAKEFYTKYKIKEDILLEWPSKKDEDFYNHSHANLKNYYVLDKVINDNIELCDLLILKDDKVHFVHVKDGFNTKMRDLYIQVILSAKRLSNDLKDTERSSFLEKTLNLYNSRNPSNEIDTKSVIKKLRKDQTKVNFVMAFKNNHHKNKPILERIDLCKSNIAKYALVQVIKEMQQFKFGIEVYDISDR